MHQGIVSALALPTSEKQGVLNKDARHGVGGMRELEPGAHIAGGVHAPVAGPELIVDDDALRPSFDSGPRHLQPIDVRHAARGDEEAVTRDLLLHATRIG